MLSTYRIRRYFVRFPLLVLMVFLIAGQYLQAVYGYFFLACAVLLLLIRNRAGAMIVFILISVLAGSAGLVSTSFQAGGVKLLNTESYFIRVVETPRFRRVGEVSHVFELYQPDNPESLSFKGSGLKIYCRGKDLPWENESDLEEGDYAFIRGRFSEVKFSYNPFSYNQKLYRQGIRFECKLTNVSKSLRKKSIISELRESLIRDVKNIAGDNEKTGLFLSMTLGVQDMLAYETEDAFKEAGLAHLLVVSGYQLSIIYITSFTLFTVLLINIPTLYLYIPVSLISSLLSFTLCISYAVLVGFETSVMRAVIAALIFILSSMYERSGGFFNQILLSLLLLQLIFPLSLFEPGVQLTYAALCGMALSSWDGADFGLFASLKSSVYASLATSVVSFLWFGTFSFLGVILNPLFASVMSVISCNFGFLALVLFKLRLDPEGYLILAVADCLEYFKDFTVWIAG